MSVSPTIQLTLLRHQTAIDEALHQTVYTAINTAIASGTPDLASYYGQIQYHLGWVDAHLTPTTSNPGKLLRPTLLVLAYEAAGAAGLDTSNTSYLRRALPAVATVPHSGSYGASLKPSILAMDSSPWPV